MSVRVKPTAYRLMLDRMRRWPIGWLSEFAKVAATVAMMIPAIHRALYEPYAGFDPLASQQIRVAEIAAAEEVERASSLIALIARERCPVVATVEEPHPMVQLNPPWTTFVAAAGHWQSCVIGTGRFFTSKESTCCFVGLAPSGTAATSMDPMNTDPMVKVVQQSVKHHPRLFDMSGHVAFRRIVPRYRRGSSRRRQAARFCMEASFALACGKKRRQRGSRGCR